MDRIAKALEMARQARPAAARNVTPFERPASAPIVYTRTRCVKVSQDALDRRRVLNRHSDPRIVDAYRLLRTRVLHRMRQNNWVTLGVTSAGAREGKTLTSVNLGISIAREVKHTVLLVDADLRRPALHSTLGLQPKYGIGDHLIHGTPVEEILVHPGIDRFVVLPGHRQAEDASEHLGSPAMEAMVHELKHRYSGRIVIFDLPPVLVGDDVVAFAPCLDAVLLVADEGHTDSTDFRKTIDLLDGVDVIGTVLNKSEEKTRAYDQYYY